MAKSPVRNPAPNPSDLSLFAKEERVLAFWKKNRIFERSLRKNPRSKIFSFYDGPPFITGMPHYGTLLPSIAKDIIPRYQTMRGRYVPRVWGWDVHGLPAENKVEEQLGLRVKKDIERYGVGNFIKAARQYVAKGSKDWRWYIDHIGRWVEIDKPYRTDTLNYMESVIWAFKELYNKGLIYKGRRVSLYCPRCATPLSKFEVTMDTDENYRDVADPAVTIAFPLKDSPETYILAWTTTPWTLPANNGLAVNPHIKYIVVTDGRKKYILAEKALERYPEFSHWKKIKTVTGKSLIGKSFIPLFEIDVEKSDSNYRVWGASFANAEEGTGVVHIAPGFGEDDFNLGLAHKLNLPTILDEDGKFLEHFDHPWASLYFKKADPLIIEDLEKRSLLIRRETITHAYPHCYRCSTPLIYMAQSSWFMKIGPIRKQMLEANEHINWVPPHFGVKRFKYNINNAPDWSISRTRYWGVPIPVWETRDGERAVIGSLAELEKLSGKKVHDLHRPGIDEVVLTLPSGKKAYRVKEVLDVWFESGSMPFAQDHYPFENKQKFEAGFPADFIIEYTGQLRGWFYYLHVLANALWDKPAFTNVITTGVLMGTDGRKMSKNYGNYPDPRQIIEKYGAEALRLYFSASKVMLGEDPNMNEEGIREARNTVNILHNTHKYLLTYADLHHWRSFGSAQGRPFGSAQGRLTKSTSNHILDRWINIRLEQFIQDYSGGLDTFDLPKSTRAIQPFVEDLSTWYIRRSRDRFAGGDPKALATLHSVLLRFSQAVAPTLPFTAEHIYHTLRGVKDPQSVHLCNYPRPHTLSPADKKLLEKMGLVRTLASAVHTLRAKAQQPLRQRMAAVVLKGTNELKTERALTELLRDEINVESVSFYTKRPGKNFVSVKVGRATVYLDKNLTEKLVAEGLLRELMRGLQDARKKAGLNVGQKVDLAYTTDSQKLLDLIGRETDRIKELGHLKEIRKESAVQGEKLFKGELTIAIRK
ncbi:MAG: isoleucine--tRNA ligase [Candidatus Colwellbacteria bacterium]|nr:isoleucine--tRNA ligase [Candidatus Colwellbacteria bacterium]